MLYPVKHELAVLLYPVKHELAVLLYPVKHELAVLYITSNNNKIMTFRAKKKTKGVGEDQNCKCTQL